MGGIFKLLFEDFGGKLGLSSEILLALTELSLALVSEEESGEFYGAFNSTPINGLGVLARLVKEEEPTVNLLPNKSSNIRLLYIEITTSTVSLIIDKVNINEKK